MLAHARHPFPASNAADARACAHVFDALHKCVHLFLKTVILFGESLFEFGHGNTSD